MNKKQVSYVIMSLFFATLAVIVFIGIGLLVQPASKRAACEHMVTAVCKQMVVCDHFANLDTCEDAFDKEGVCTSDIKSSVQEIQQCTTDLQHLKDCNTVPASCMKLE